MYSWGWGFGLPRLGRHEGRRDDELQRSAEPGLPERSSAKRIARRVAVTFMQGTFGDETGDLFDYGFGQIFHPDARGSSALGGRAGRYDLDCISSSRCVSAAVPSTERPGRSSSRGRPDVDSSPIASPGSGTCARLRLFHLQGGGKGEVRTATPSAHAPSFRARSSSPRGKGSSGRALPLVDRRRRSTVAGCRRDQGRPRRPRWICRPSTGTSSCTADRRTPRATLDREVVAPRRPGASSTSTRTATSRASTARWRWPDR